MLSFCSLCVERIMEYLYRHLLEIFPRPNFISNYESYMSNSTVLAYFWRTKDFKSELKLKVFRIKHVITMSFLYYKSLHFWKKKWRVMLSELSNTV